jgi:hypothetical protein
MSLQPHFHRSVQNITKFGDTDVFPFPLENSIFYDCSPKIVSLLEHVHSTFDHILATEPPFNENQLAPIGYSGFRWVTQLDPLWNAYFLSLVTALGAKIEAKRIPATEQCIFSYRFCRWH